MRGQTVLIADDEEEVRQLVREVLEENHFRVLEATNGTEVMKEVNRERIDLVILDLVMPEKEGIETLRMLRTDRPEVKVLAISGAFGGSFLKCARSLGAHGALKKPFSCESLIAGVSNLLK